MLRSALIAMMFVIGLSVLGGLGGLGAAAGGAEIPPGLEAVLNGDHRDPDNVKRDPHRHPAETLGFFGLKPDLTVIEIWPGYRGWYLEILAPYLRDRGTYIAASFDRDSEREFIQRSIRILDEKLAARPDLYDRVVLTELSRSKMDIAPPNSADMILTFRNFHNWQKFGYADEMFAMFYRTLKPGGILGFTDHRADPDAEPDADPINGYAYGGYAKAADAIAAAEAAGFELVGAADINANPRDTKNHPNGVWTLPPTNRHDPAERAKYQAIGESDRMTLKFRKPLDG